MRGPTSACIRGSTRLRAHRRPARRTSPGVYSGKSDRSARHARLVRGGSTFRSVIRSYSPRRSSTRSGVLCSCLIPLAVTQLAGPFSIILRSLPKRSSDVRFTRFWTARTGVAQPSPIQNRIGEALAENWRGEHLTALPIEQSDPEVAMTRQGVVTGPLESSALSETPDRPIFFVRSAAIWAVSA